jgi:quercetin dioxygenase-like cupin family protein
MKSLAVAAVLLLVFSVAAQAPVPVPLARAGVPGEPHHHLQIENAFVRVYFVEVPAHGETQLHQHDEDYVYVAIGAADVTSAIPGKPEVQLQLADGEVRFTRGGFAHVARNNAGTVFHNVTIVLLRPQENPRNLERQIVPGPLHPPIRTGDKLPAGIDTIGLFETEEITVEQMTLEPRFNHFETDTPSASLLVATGERGLTVRATGQRPQELALGGVLWLPPGKWSTHAPRGTTLRCLWIKFKDRETPARQ